MNTIYYFSGTGNSLAAAEILAENLGNTVLKPITKELEKGTPIIEGETTGLAFPIYFLGIPAIVKKFIQEAVWKSPGYFYIAATKGWPVVGAPAAHVKKLLKKTGVSLNASFHIHMAGNNVLLAGIPDPSGWGRRLGSVPDKIRKISGKIKRRSGYKHPKPTAPLLKSRYKIYLNYCNKASKMFTVYPDKCSGCALCARICALSNICIKQNKPVYGNNCQLCEACYNICPEQAISLGNPKLESRQYWNPGISAGKITSQKINTGKTFIDVCKT